MTKYELIAKCAKYTAIVTSIYIISRCGLNVYFDKNLNKE